MKENNILATYYDFSELPLAFNGMSGKFVGDNFSINMLETVQERNKCRMCGEDLKKVSTSCSKSFQQYVDKLNKDKRDLCYTWQIVQSDIWECIKCKWWTIVEAIDLPEWHDVTVIMTQGSIKRFNVSELEVPINLLREFIADNPDAIYKVNPFTFEKLVAECLRVEYGPCEVFHVGSKGGMGDGGIDILLFRDNEEWLIQVKRRSNKTNEGVEAVRQLNGVLLREGKTKGMLISSAINFSPKAKDEIKIKTKTQEPYEVKLIPRGGIENMITNPNHRRAENGWELFLKYDLSEIKDDFKRQTRYFSRKGEY